MTMTAQDIAPLAREILLAAADRLEQPGAWTQGRAAVDSNGIPTYPLDSEACSWCLYGAVWREAAERRLSIFGEEVAAIEGFLFDRNLPFSWNDSDGREQAEVVAALRRVAAELSDSQDYGK